MYSYNSFHKIIVVGLVIAWAMYQFNSRNNDDLKYSNGEPIRTGETLNSKNQGTWTWYHQNGKVQITGAFNVGKREGVWKSFDTLGNIMIESNYRNNLLDGVFIQYGTNGEIIRKDLYKEDKLINSVPIE